MKTNTLPVTTEDMFIRDVEGIAFDANGKIYITNQAGGNVLVFNLP